MNHEPDKRLLEKSIETLKSLLVQKDSKISELESQIADLKVILNDSQLQQIRNNFWHEI